MLSRLLAAEASAGRYPATRAFLQLVTALVTSGAAAPEQQASLRNCGLQAGVLPCSGAGCRRTSC